jgi:hypothetical protein
MLTGELASQERRGDFLLFCNDAKLRDPATVHQY